MHEILVAYQIIPNIGCGGVKSDSIKKEAQRPEELMEEIQGWIRS